MPHINPALGRLPAEILPPTHNAMNRSLQTNNIEANIEPFNLQIPVNGEEIMAEVSSIMQADPVATAQSLGFRSSNIQIVPEEAVIHGIIQRPDTRSEYYIKVSRETFNNILHLAQDCIDAANTRLNRTRNQARTCVTYAANDPLTKVCCIPTLIGTGSGIAIGITTNPVTGAILGLTIGAISLIPTALGTIMCCQNAIASE